MENQDNYADLIIKNCSILAANMEIMNDQSIVIKDKKINDIGNTTIIDSKYTARESIDGKGKFVMPGLIDSHMHTCQQLLRGRITDEYPMIWTRIMVPYESNLKEKDVHISSQLACLEAIKCGTTGIIDAGGPHMHKVAEAVIESGIRAAITCSTMDFGNGIPANMKSTTEEAIAKNESLYIDYNGMGGGRLDVWFSLRSIINCTPNLILKVFEIAKEYNTRVQAHMNEYTNEISYCLQNYKKRPLEFLESLGVLSSNFLSAHSILLSENELDIIKNYNIKVSHCPISNSGKGVPKTPSLLQRKISIALGTDGAAHSGLSLFDQMKVFKSLIRLQWGVPIFDPAVIPSSKIIEMATIGGAKVLGHEDTLGTLEIGKKADMISINIDQPHISPTHNLINTLAESVNSNDVIDMIVDGKVVMKNREVLTLDEEKIKYESRVALKDISLRAGIY